MNLSYERTIHPAGFQELFMSYNAIVEDNWLKIIQLYDAVNKIMTDDLESDDLAQN